MNVSKTEIANALSILLAAVNNQTTVDIEKHRYTVEEAQHALDTMVGITSSTIYCADEVATVFSDYQKMQHKYDMSPEQIDFACGLAHDVMATGFDFEDAVSTLKKVSELDGEYGDLDEIEERLKTSTDAVTWWEEHGDDADDMVDVWNACKRYDICGEYEIKSLGKQMQKYDFDVMDEAYECYDLMGDYDCEDAAEVMDIMARHNLTLSDIRNLIEGKAEQDAIVEKYKAIAAIVNPNLFG